MEVDNIEFYESKIKCLLEKFLEPGFQLKNDVYFNSLLSHLSGKGNKELGILLLRLPLFPEWIVQALTFWETTGNMPDSSIASFSIQLTALLSRDEDTFSTLSNYNVFDKLINVLRIKQGDVSPSIKLAYIKLQSSLLRHQRGFRLLVKNKYWEDALGFCLSPQRTMFVSREGHDFIAAFIEEAYKNDSELCLEIWRRALGLLHEDTFKVFKANGDMFAVCDEQVYSALEPALSLVSDVLLYMLNKALETGGDFDRSLTEFLKQLQIDKCVDNYLLIARSNAFYFDLGKIYVLYEILLVVLQAENGTCSNDVGLHFRQQICEFILTAIEQGHKSVVLKFCCFTSNHWSRTRNVISPKSPATMITDGKGLFTLDDQLITLQLLPLFILCEQFYWKNRAGGEEVLNQDDLREHYIDKMLNSLCQKTIRLAYIWRDSIGSRSENFDLANQAMSSIVQTKPYYTKESAVLAFQTFVYSVKDILKIIKRKPEMFAVFVGRESFVKQLLEAIYFFITDFDISWRDSVESICVMNLAFDFLVIGQWSSNLVVAALKLLHVSLAKYMSPNMALLIDHIVDTPGALLGPLLYAKLHDSAWQVRDTALEVVTIIADVSKCQFPSLQTIILEPELPALVVQIALSDGESFVRASALKCLSQMVRVKVFWNGTLEKQNIPQRAMNLLKCETEGIVRVQAADLLTSVFKHQPMSAETMRELYDAMNRSALCDLHWEVRTTVLDFWEEIVDELLKKQGMIDSAFPEFTFSAENKKIVTLTETEIGKRLKKVLSQLSDSGCLTVITVTVSQDCDLQVSRRALKIVDKLAKLLRKYGVTSSETVGEDGVPLSPVGSSVASSGISSMCCASSSIDPDEIINQIVNSSDTTLLQDVYTPGGESPPLLDHACAPILRRSVTCAEFIAFAQKNFERVVEDREKWLQSMDSFSSLLNDMLHSCGGCDDLNLMDCY